MPTDDEIAEAVRRMQEAGLNARAMRRREDPRVSRAALAILEREAARARAEAAGEKGGPHVARKERIEVVLDEFTEKRRGKRPIR